MATSHSTLYIGLISGTSMDGIDAALVDEEQNYAVLASHTHPYPTAVRSMLQQLSQNQMLDRDSLATLDQQLGELFAEAAITLLQQANMPTSAIAAIGSHGQTLYHRPKSKNLMAYSLQIADPNIIAERTGITTVSDFRRRDIAAGGEGAPLVPAFHAAVLHSDKEDRAVINIGGIANITLLPSNGAVSGFDIGPGNGLMDQWLQRHFGQPYDAAGKLAAEGKVIQRLLDRLLQDTFFQHPPPKSTGPEYFNLQWLQQYLTEDFALSNNDILATLNALTAQTICQTIKRYANNTKRIFLCGGGVHNTTLVTQLQNLMPERTIASTAVLGLNPDFIEAAAFAWLAHRTLGKLPSNIPTVTGAKSGVILGGIYQSNPDAILKP